MCREIQLLHHLRPRCRVFAAYDEQEGRGEMAATMLHGTYHAASWVPSRERNATFSKSAMPVSAGFNKVKFGEASKSCITA